MNISATLKQLVDMGISFTIIFTLTMTLLTTTVTKQEIIYITIMAFILTLLFQIAGLRMTNVIWAIVYKFMQILISYWVFMIIVMFKLYQTFRKAVNNTL